MHVSFDCIVPTFLTAQKEQGETDLFFRAKFFFRDQFLVSLKCVNLHTVHVFVCGVWGGGVWGRLKLIVLP